MCPALGLQDAASQALECQCAIASVWRTRRAKTDKGVGDSPGTRADVLAAALAAASTVAALAARFAFLPLGSS
jgi:hypothetical protein